MSASHTTISQRMIRHEALTRAAVLVTAATTCAMALLVPDSIAARMVAAGGTSALVVTLVFTAIIGLSAVDWVVNDLMPDDYSAEPLERSRHMSYSAIGVGYLIQAMAIAGAKSLPAGAWVPLLSYVSLGVVCGWLAVVSAMEAADAR